MTETTATIHFERSYSPDGQRETVIATWDGPRSGVVSCSNEFVEEGLIYRLPWEMVCIARYENYSDWKRAGGG